MRLSRRGTLMSVMNYIAPLSVARSNLAAAVNGNALVFAGGMVSAGHVGTDEYFGTVDAYGADFTRVNPTELLAARSRAAGASVDQYALIAGGESVKSEMGSYYIAHGTVDAYNASLTRSTPTALSSGRSDLAGASVGNYALFAGGTSSSDGLRSVTPLSTVNAYNASLTRSTPTALSVARVNLAGASVGNYALFAGGGGFSGDDYLYHNTVNAYNASLTRSTPTALSVARSGLAGSSNGSYAVFAGGDGNDSEGSPLPNNAVDAYNASLTRSIPAPIPMGSVESYAARAGTSVVVAGRVWGFVYAYDASLTLTQAVKGLGDYPFDEGYGKAAGTIGDSAFFAGGSLQASDFTRIAVARVTVYTGALRRFKSVR